MKYHRGIVVAGFSSVEMAMHFNDTHKDILEGLGYHLMIIPSNDENYIKLLSVENVSETDLKELLNQLDK